MCPVVCTVDSCTHGIRVSTGSSKWSVVGATLEGSRALLVEVQALVAPTVYGTPRRTAIGIDPGRLALLVAVLGRRAGIGGLLPRLP